MVESQPSKLLVAGSIPVSRSRIIRGGLAPLGLPLRRRSLGRGPRIRSGGALRFARALRLGRRILRLAAFGPAGVSQASGVVHGE